MPAVPFEMARWELVPGRTVLVIIDDQNDFLHPDGWYATHGIDIAHMRRVIEPTKELIAECRRARRARSSGRGTARAGSRTAGRSCRSGRFFATGGLRIGTWGYEILDELEPAARRLVSSRRRRLSAFFQTNLEQRPAGARRRDRCSSRACSRTSASARRARTRCSATSSRSSSRSASARRSRTCTSRRSR